jgi:site-specific DNA-cytosine methylase
MNVLSLFDGISCGRLALDRANVTVDTYLASEVDRYAINVAKSNYPDTIHLGDVRNVGKCDVSLPEIDLLIGGSPCQGFSFAGKQLNFNDPRSQLFFEYVRVLKETKPKYFLLENVRMKQESMDAITDLLGVEPVAINSNLVSAQNRYRLYWTNIPMDELPDDKGIMLKDIIEDDYVTDRDKSHCIDANYFKGGNLKSYFEKHRRQLVFSDNLQPKILQRGRGFNSGGIKAKDGKTPSLSTSSWEHNNHLTFDEGFTWRKLTPLECERLQTVPDNYTKGVSNTQRYKMLGNGWTVDVVAHIFRGLHES